MFRILLQFTDFYPVQERAVELRTILCIGGEYGLYNY